MSTVVVSTYESPFISVGVTGTCAYYQQIGNILRTTDGVTFTQTGRRPSDFSQLLGARMQGVLFARDNRESTLYVSVDEGASWSGRSVPVDNGNYFFYASTDRILLYYADRNRVFSSANDGVSWAEYVSPDVATIVPVPSGFYMVSANRLGLQYSTDGLAWQPVPSEAPLAALQPARSSGEVFVAAQDGYLSSLAVVKDGRLTTVPAPTARFNRSGLAATRVGDGVLVADPTRVEFLAYATLSAAPEVVKNAGFVLPSAGGPVGSKAFSIEGYVEFTPSGGAVSTLFWETPLNAFETP